MKFDIVLAGVGGQGVLSVAAIVADAARREGLEVKQTEVHGMAQRGGAVQAMLRIADSPVSTELVPRGTADLVLGLEPVEALRHLSYLAPDGVLITAADPVADLADYPPVEDVHRRARSLGGMLVEADELGAAAGSKKAANIAMLGAASTVIPLPPDALEQSITAAFAERGDAVVATNLAAFRAGRAALTPLPG
jgi:indolepyruvate ferredoxin oxidoreductase beta subunit